ncbi:MAG TPA: protein-disulfide reductase DsbD domain-containing protein [Blastocatellia bacterium]|nr:protein-disulfide reductase DsbD domain-containing protein [Blastocatellia bacterium]
MKKAILLFSAIAVVSLSAVSQAQTSASVVKVKPQESVYKIKPGATFQVAVVLEIDGGYHINSNQPAEKFLIPTTLKVETLKGLRANAVRYPKAKIQKFSFAEKPMSVFDGRTVLRFTARALPTLAGGSHTLKAKLTVQACNDEMCLRPQTVNVEIPLEVSM